MNSYKTKVLIFALIFSPITFSLGLWQIDRAKEKDVIIDQFNELQKKPHAEIQSQASFENWEPVTAFGSFTDYVLLEDNALLNGLAGYKVYQYFKFEDNSGLFVHRGFVEREQLKNNTPEINVPEGDFMIMGTALYKKENSFIKNIEESDKRVIQEFNIDHIYKIYPELKMHEIMPFIFNLDSNNQFKFKQIEKPINMPSEKHIGYAIQWFGLCLALIILTIMAFIKKDE